MRWLSPAAANRSAAATTSALGAHLDTEVVERRARLRVLEQHQLERRVGDLEVGVAGALLGRADAEQIACRSGWRRRCRSRSRRAGCGWCPWTVSSVRSRPMRDSPSMTNSVREWTHPGRKLRPFRATFVSTEEGGQMNVELIDAHVPAHGARRQLDRHARTAAGLRRRPGRRPRARGRHHAGRDRAQHRVRRPRTGRQPGRLAVPVGPQRGDRPLSDTPQRTTAHRQLDAWPDPDGRRPARTRQRANCRAASSRCSTSWPRRRARRSFVSMSMVRPSTERRASSGLSLSGHEVPRATRPS